jgi:hypothetical protein
MAIFVGCGFAPNYREGVNVLSIKLGPICVEVLPATNYLGINQAAQTQNPSSAHRMHIKELLNDSSNPTRL